MKTAGSRKLPDNESKKLRLSLLGKWNLSLDGLQSLAEVSPRPVVTVAKDDITETDYTQIIQLISLYTNHVFHLPETGNDTEIPVMFFHPDTAESVFCDETFEWIIYGSFDGTLTFGGEWLTELVCKMFSARKDKIVISKKHNRAC